MPLVSVFIPSFNGAIYVQAAIDSVLSQNVEGIEIIVSDDASTDGTADVVANCRDPRVQLVRHADNVGAEGNWNRMLAVAAGTYIKLLPQDDLLRPNCLARQIAVLEADAAQRIALVFGARDIINSEDDVIARRGMGRHPGGRIAARDLILRCVRGGTNVIGEPGAVLFRRSLAQKIGAFHATQPYVIDLDYWIRLLAHGDAWYLAEPVSAFRVSRQSWSVAIGRKQGSQFHSFLHRMKAAGLIDVGAFDIALGKLIANCNNLLRLAFYRFVVR